MLVRRLRVLSPAGNARYGVQSDVGWYGIIWVVPCESHVPLDYETFYFGIFDLEDGDMLGSEIRRKYVEFFHEKGHEIVPSASLVPRDDASLLWINSGMAPLKRYFDGRETPDNLRLTNSQKCIRTNDIELVGKTARHHTFFEMMGNFSIGDYFKREAIHWAWEFVTQRIHLDVTKLSVTIHPEDDEAFAIWHREIGLSEERILRLEENFWDIGEGPCGPNSEIVRRDASTTAETMLPV